jgi:hypothetical protein
MSDFAQYQVFHLFTKALAHRNLIEVLGHNNNETVSLSTTRLLYTLSLKLYEFFDEYTPDYAILFTHMGY